MRIRGNHIERAKQARLLLVCLYLTIAALVVAGQAKGEAGEILQGTAAIISAASPIGVAAAEAGAAKAVAGINAGASVATAQIQAATTLELANLQSQVALAQTYASVDINRIQNEGQTERLGMQLAELRAAREDAMQSEHEKRMIELEYNRERIALAYKQADDNYKLAMSTLNAQLAQAGLISGFKSIDSSKGLTIRKSLTSGGSAGMAPTSSLASNTALGAMGGPSVGAGLTTRTLPKAKLTKRLLASVEGYAAIRGAAGSGTTVGDKIRNVLDGNLGQGSTRGMRFRDTKPPSDLVAFRTAVTGSPTGRPRVVHVAEEPVPAGGGHRGAANH